MVPLNFPFSPFCFIHHYFFKKFAEKNRAKIPFLKIEFSFQMKYQTL